jgi:hypothetical protein
MYGILTVDCKATSTGNEQLACFANNRITEEQIRTLLSFYVDKTVVPNETGSDGL